MWIYLNFLGRASDRQLARNDDAFCCELLVPSR
jgi:hypothetical protein